MKRDEQDSKKQVFYCIFKHKLLSIYKTLYTLQVFFIPYSIALLENKLVSYSYKKKTQQSLLCGFYSLRFNIHGYLICKNMLKSKYITKG